MSVQRLLSVVAAFLILDLVGVYAFSLNVKGRYPPSHPWSGITVALMAMNLILQARQRQRSDATPLPSRVWVSAAAALIASILWTIAALISR